MTDFEQISRTGLTWILIAQAAILAPHLVHAPVWIWAVWLVVVVWRLQVFRGAWPFPGRLLKVTLIGICCAGLFLTLRGKFNMQGMVVLLLMGFILKLLEMKKRRDFLALCCLGYFVIATQFLFFSNLFAALYGLLCLVLLTTALLAVNQSLTQQSIGRSFRLSTGILLRTLPLLLLLFVLTPRLAPLWAVPGSSAAKTGISDTMSPGDFNQLMSSNDPAFRATFVEGRPRQAQLYWRGLVFSRFDGRTWYQSHTQMMSTNLRWAPADTQELLQQIAFGETELRYDIIMEPSQQPWVYTLTAPRQWDGGLGLGYDLRLQHVRPITQRFQYRVTSVPDYRYQAEGLANWQAEQELALPLQHNPQTRALAQTWMAEAKTPQAYIEKVLAFYRANFTYTLQPELLGDNPVDEFLLRTQAGFCEHFSSSFVVLMRAAGIPARVVVGYQGGSYNPGENYWLVRQRDAHAWAEVWIQGQGWVHVDPTAAVAPERIERGIDFSLNEADSRLLGNTLSRSSALINQFSMYWDAVNYNWTRWVLNYNNVRQQQLLGNWVGDISLRKLGMLALGIAGLVALGWVWLLYRGRRVFKFPADRYYLRFNRKLARVSLARQPGESPREFARRVALARPDLASGVQAITRFYELANYGGDNTARADLARAVHRFSP